MRLFKYVGSHVVDILRDRRLKVTPPDSFDDPFEFCPQVEDFSEHELAEYIREHMGENDFIRRLVAKGVVRNRDEAGKLWHDPAVRLACGVGLKRVAKSHVEEHQKRASSEFGVICFTESEADLLMWSFYAAAHRGAQIEFDPSEIKRSWGPLLQVNYGPERPSFSPMAVA